MEPMTDQTDAEWITISAYAAREDTPSRRTVTRMIDEGRLPAQKVDGVWLIPANALPLDPASGQLLPTRPKGAAAAPATSATIEEILSTLPGYLTLDVASRLLGIPESQIRRHREFYDLVDHGAIATLVMPQSTVRRVFGLVR